MEASDMDIIDKLNYVVSEYNLCWPQIRLLMRRWEVTVAHSLKADFR